MAILLIRLYRRSRYAWTLIAGLAITASFVAGCSVTDDGYTFVNNAKENLFFRLPDEWGRYPVRAETILDRPVPITGVSTRWAVQFDGAKAPSQNHVDEMFTSSPVGFSESFELSAAGQDTVNEKTLRSLVVSDLVSEMSDPFDLADEVPDRVEIVKYTRIRNKAGVTGHKIIVNVKIDPDESGELKWLTIGQKVYLDRNAEKLRRLVIRCSSECYRANQSTLDTVLDSFSFRP